MSSVKSLKTLKSAREEKQNEVPTKTQPSFDRANMTQGSRGGTDSNDINNRTGQGFTGAPENTGTSDEENEYQTDTQQKGDGYD